MPRPMYRSRSVRKLDRVTPKKRHVVHYVRKKNSMPHCAICGKELNGIATSKSAKGKSLRTNTRLFGGVLCANCTARIIKLASRIENGEMKLNDIRVKEREFVLQTMAH